MINGQLDLAHKLVPSLFNLLNTYRGDIDTTPLRNRKELIETLYEEVHTTGMLSEKTMNEMNIPLDKTTQGVVVNRGVGIRLEILQFWLEEQIICMYLHCTCIFVNTLVHVVL